MTYIERTMAQVSASTNKEEAAHELSLKAQADYINNDISTSCYDVILDLLSQFIHE